MNSTFQAWTPLVKELVITSETDQIIQVERLIEEVKDDLEFRDDVYGNVMVATTEAVNNSIIHGNRLDAKKRVFIRFETINPYRLMIKVVDEGVGFSPEQLADPTAPENLENPGGRGVFLMTHLCDEIKFEDQGRVVQMFFNI
jgi:serine/threonine-protein kinase RsbW